MKNSVTHSASRPVYRRAFTLIEVLLVIALMAVVSSISYPSISRWQRTIELDQMADDIRQFLQQGRLKAIDTALPVRFMLNFDQNLLSEDLKQAEQNATAAGLNRFQLPQKFRLLKEINIEDSLIQSDAQICFQPDGTATNALIVVESISTGDRKILNVVRLTGSVEVSE